MIKQPSFTERCLLFCRKTPQRERLIVRCCRALPWMMAVVYFVVGLYHLFGGNRESIFRVILVPFSALVVATLLRRCLNIPRPHQKQNIRPLLVHSDGNAFPSRHAVSAAVISAACWYTCVWLGVAAIILTLFTAISRVLCGVHFVRDVAVGCSFGWLWGFIFFFVL